MLSIFARSFLTATRSRHHDTWEEPRQGAPARPYPGLRHSKHGDSYLKWYSYTGNR